LSKNLETWKLGMSGWGDAYFTQVRLHTHGVVHALSSFQKRNVVGAACECVYM
jgi:hypothetical protein